MSMSKGRTDLKTSAIFQNRENRDFALFWNRITLLYKRFQWYFSSTNKKNHENTTGEALCFTYEYSCK